MNTEFERRRSHLSEKKEPARKDNFLKVLQIQLIICALIFLCALGIKIINNNMYSTVKVGTFNTSYRLSNLGDLNNKLDNLAASNKFFAFFFGRAKSAPVFSEQPVTEESSNTDVSSETTSSETTSSNATTSSALSGVGEGLEMIPVVSEFSMPESQEEIDDSTPNLLKMPPVLEEKVTLPEKIVKPLNGSISSPFGVRNDPFTSKLSFHTGIDIPAKSGTSVKAAMSGKVYATGTSSVGGKYILIEHSNGFYTYYGHLSKILVKKGAKVGSGAKIALSGNTGRSTGPHLHFEIRKDGKYTNPQFYLTY